MLTEIAISEWKGYFLVVEKAQTYFPLRSLSQLRRKPKSRQRRYNWQPSNETVPERKIQKQKKSEQFFFRFTFVGFLQCVICRWMVNTGPKANFKICVFWVYNFSVKYSVVVKTSRIKLFFRVWFSLSRYLLPWLCHFLLDDSFIIEQKIQFKPSRLTSSVSFQYFCANLKKVRKILFLIYFNKV
jgi:hypothetical protein